MPKISVITPTNSAEFFAKAKASMLRQTLTDWEWIVLWNGGVFVPDDDPRIKCVPTQVGLASVGALKREACTYISSLYCVEFDHDDELSRDCLEKVYNAFVESGAVFVFSDDCRVKKNGVFDTFGEDYGWSHRKVIFKGEKDEEVVSHHTPCLLPQMVSRIWYAPDHVRAWRMDAYVAVGGHKADLKICDDQDLMARLYKFSGGKFHHIPECLYKYNVHGANTWLKNNAEIQKTCLEMHDSNIQDMALAYWKDKARLVDLGGATGAPVGWETVDLHDAKIISDLNGTWPFDQGSVGAIRAFDVVSQLRSHVHVMNEAWRVLKHGGLFLIEVASSDGRGAYQDPSHVSFWNANSNWYYTKSAFQKFISHLGPKHRFQLIRNVTYFPTEWHKLNQIPYLRLTLAAVKDGPRLHGPLEI